MSFVATIFGHFATHPEKPFIIEMHGDTPRPISGADLTDRASRVRGFLRAKNLSRGDRVVLIAPNSADWVAADLGALAEGAVVVPMYARQKASELIEMVEDCGAVLVICATKELQEKMTKEGLKTETATFDQVFAARPETGSPLEVADDEAVTIVYTSGSTGSPKGVVLSMQNVDYMLPQTSTALTRMMALGEPVHGDDTVFHYLPFCFAGSRIVLWTSLYRNNGLHISTDLEQLQAELGAVKPNYFLNVPVLLERIKNGVEAQIAGRPAPIRWLYESAKRAFAAKVAGEATVGDRAILRMARAALFSRIKAKIGPNLRALICGSAPLGEDTQRWFEMLGIPVLQVYGLTETTAIVTMDRPSESVIPGRVGPALEGVEVRLGDGDEIQVRGPNIFSGYWEKPEATTAAFTDDGWFRTGDRGEQNQDGNWKIIGRVKNLLVPSSGHNVAPEPIEQVLVERIEGVEQALVVGHARPFLVALITGEAEEQTVQSGIDAINEGLPHYKRIRAFRITEEPFTIENGLLTANQKVRRDAVETAHSEAIEAMYP